jgi:hypothetical protein
MISTGIILDRSTGRRLVMEVSKLKIELYDLLAILLPGLILMFELSVSILGWSATIVALRGASASSFTFLLFSAFAVGQFVQETGDFVLKRVKGPRFFKRERDRYWISADAALVKAKLKQICGNPIESVDVAFDYCLSCVGSQFAKRDVFIALSDFARSLWVLSILALIPVLSLCLRTPGGWTKVEFLVGSSAVLTVLALLAWRRMLRFRALTETPVFNSFLAFSAPKSESGSCTEESE